MIKIIKTRSATVETSVSSANEGTIDLIFTTGYKGMRHDFGESFYEELEVSETALNLERLNRQAPLLNQHSPTVKDTLGVVERAWVEGGIGKATVRLSEREDLKGILKDIQSGILRNISVGYTVEEFTDVTKKGDKIRTLKATRWTPHEISVVATGFDPYAQTLRESEEQSNEVTIINQRQEDTMLFEEMNDEEKMTFIKAKMDAGEALSEAEQKAYEEIQAKTAPKEEVRTEPVIDIEAAQRNAVAEYKTRCKDITSAVQAAKLPQDFAADLIERNLSMSEASQEIFKQLQTQNETKTGVEPKKEFTMTKRELVEQALLNRIDAKRFKADSSNPYKQATLIEMIEGIVERQPNETKEKFAKRAATTTSALTELLANVASKVMGEDGSEKFSYEQWTGYQSLRNFQQTPIIQLSGVTLAAKTEGGAYADATLVDSDEKIQLEERGIMLNLSQKAIINDDLGALKALPQRAASAGKRDIEKKVYALLVANPTMSDSVALFHASHGNLTAAGGVPSVASVQAANIKMAAQNDGSGDPLDLRVKYLIVPPAYEFEARQIASSAMVPGSVTAVNPFAGQIEVVVSSRLAAGAWYVACDQNQLASIVYATLEGMSEPNVETQIDFATSNLQTKIEFPSGVAAANYKGIVKISVA